MTSTSGTIQDRLVFSDCTPKKNSLNESVLNKSIGEKSEQLKNKMEKMRKAIEDYKEYKIE
jgi:hypothetical protein